MKSVISLPLAAPNGMFIVNLQKFYKSNDNFHDFAISATQQLTKIIDDHLF